MKNKWMKDNIGLMFVLPWVIGFLLFTVFPMLAASYISMTDWPIIGAAEFVGIKNFIAIFKDENFYKVLWITIRFAVFNIPLSITISLMVAMSLNKAYKSVGIFRTIFYMPAIVSGVAVAIVFKWILDPTYGLINSILGIIGVEGPNWLFDPNWVLPSYLVMAAWAASGGLLTFLVGLKEIPKELYEAAEIDGANVVRKVQHIMLPLITPIIFYNVVITLIASFRKFTDAYVFGGAGGEGKFYMVHLYEQAFTFFKMGYATALAWVLFVIILLLTLFINKTKKYWVYNR